MMFFRIGALIAAALIAACGGGGGGGGGGGFPVTGIPSVPPGGGSGATTVALSGAVTYDYVPNTSGPLVYGATASKPVRGATVEVLNSASGAVLASAATDDNGRYTANVPASTTVIVRVKAQLLQGASGGASWDVTVRDNTQSDALYSLDSPAFSSGADATLSRDLHAASGWSGSSYASTRVAGPFALLDTIYRAKAKVLSVAPSTAFPALRVFWSVNNLPSNGNPALGQIGTSFFTSTSSGRAIYVLGRENVDTDEYDESVVAHEWGHYYQSSFSRDDSPGGSHSLDQFLDRRLAFSEGWGNGWSGIAMGRANYADSVGTAQGTGSNIDLTRGPSTSPGWYREGSLQTIFWTLNQQVGFKPIHDAMTGPFKNGVVPTSIHPWAAAFASATPSAAGALTSLLSAQSISANTTDPFATSETNVFGTTAPLYKLATLGAPIQLCVTTQVAGDNKVDSYAYARFSKAAAGNVQIMVTGGPSNSDPDIEVFTGGAALRADGTTPGSETATFPVPAGESVLALTNYNSSSGASTCFSVTIQ